MNSESFTLCAKSQDGQTVYFDHYGFTLVKGNAYRYQSLGVAVMAARLEADVNGTEVVVLDADGVTVASAPVFPVLESPRPPSRMQAAQIRYLRITP